MVEEMELIVQEHLKSSAEMSPQPPFGVIKAIGYDSQRLRLSIVVSA